LIAGHPGSLLRAFIVHLATLSEVYILEAWMLAHYFSPQYQGEVESVTAMLADVIGNLESATPRLVLRGVRLFLKEIYTELAKTTSDENDHAQLTQARNYRFI